MVSLPESVGTFLSRAAEAYGPGRARQYAIYRAGVSGGRPAVPTDANGLEKAAKRRMSRRAWAYVAGGAGEGSTMSANREAFASYRTIPRVGRGADVRSLAISLFGQELASPLILSPIGAADLVTPGADLLTAQAAAATGVPMVVSSQGCAPMEEIARLTESSGGHWFQLYWSTDEALVDSFIARAEACGAGALVVTLDTTVLGWRPHDLNLGSLPFSRGIGIAQYTSDQRFRQIVNDSISAGTAGTGTGGVRITPSAAATLMSIARNHPGNFIRNLVDRQPRASVETFLDIYSNPGLNWEMLSTLTQRTRLPLVFKGILHPQDAAQAFDAGADAVVVSNHGGRQVDGSVAALDALVDIRRALGPDPTLIMDSGIRTGRDVALALSLGADAVMLGRPWLYGLAIAGQRGAQEVLANILAELDLTMALSGAADIASLRAADWQDTNSGNRGPVPE